MPDIAITMTMILGSMLAGIAGLAQLATPSQGETYVVSPSKHAYEQFVAYYSPFWMGIFGIVVVTQVYEHFTALHYSQLCFGLALPLVLQPIVWPMGPDQTRPVWQRYSFKANIWLAIYTFIGNYWYTHYFYSVLKARYTMPAHRLNDVPIAMFGATHFYFSSYHYFSNVLLRYVVKNYQPGFWRTALFVSVVITFSYFTAFMETLTISSYPYWDFEDRYMAYTVGSAFYAIYFLVSFPAFFYFDEHVDSGKPRTILETIVESFGYSMIILCGLDFVRLFLGIPLTIK